MAASPLSRIARLPPAAPGMRIGLYGGSFNPAHDGHLHVSRVALRRLALDRIWWLVSPGNPLKSHDDLAPLPDRLAAAARVAADPRIALTGFEAGLRSPYTVDTLFALRHRQPGVAFVWVMGADSLTGFHRWKGFAQIAQLMPFAVVDRPGHTHVSLRARAAQALGRYRIDENDASILADLTPPAWVFLHGPRSSLSSTQLREDGRGYSGHKRTADLHH